MHAALGNPNPNPRTLTPTLTCASARACAHPHLHLHPNPGLTPAVDVHFFVVPIEERERLTANCTTNIPGPQNSLGQFLQCSQLATDEATLKFFKLPPPEYTTGFAASPEFGDHAIIGHGILVCLETTPAAPIFTCMAPPRKPRACMAPLTAASPPPVASAMALLYSTRQTPARRKGYGTGGSGVCHRGLEPWTSTCTSTLQAGLLLTRLSLALDRHCVSDPASANSKAGMGWLDCHSQFLGGAGIGPPGTVPLFTDLNCTCPFWDDGMTAILNVYDGKVLGNEVMPTLGHVKMLRPPPRQMCMSHVRICVGSADAHGWMGGWAAHLPRAYDGPCSH